MPGPIFRALSRVKSSRECRGMTHNVKNEFIIVLKKERVGEGRRQGGSEGGSEGF